MSASTAFIDSLGCERVEKLAGDMSPRKYFRCFKDGRSSIVMAYPQVDAAAREELSHFIKISEWLQGCGLKTPELYALDEAQGCAQFEDLGSTSFGDARRAGQDMEAFYTLGCDVLRHLKEAECPDGFADYRDSGVHEKRRQLVEYYLPFERGAPFTQEDMDGYLAAWEKVEAPLPPCPQGFLHMDFHLENLMWIEGEEGLKRCGLIDFQDAVKGPLPYDLVNLLEDARVDVPADLRAKLIARYCEGLSAEEQETFMAWYAVLAAQFHSRVIGLFIYQAVENGRNEYLCHVPRLQNYLKAALDNPVLAPFKAWCGEVGLDFTSRNDLNGDEIRSVFGAWK